MLISLSVFWCSPNHDLHIFLPLLFESGGGFRFENRRSDKMLLCVAIFHRLAEQTPKHTAVTAAVPGEFTFLRRVWYNMCCVSILCLQRRWSFNEPLGGAVDLIQLSFALSTFLFYNFIGLNKDTHKHKHILNLVVDLNTQHILEWVNSNDSCRMSSFCMPRTRKNRAPPCQAPHQPNISYHPPTCCARLSTIWFG